MDCECNKIDVDKRIQNFEDWKREIIKLGLFKNPVFLYKFCEKNVFLSFLRRKNTEATDGS